MVADEAYGRQIPFAFLERVRDEFDAKHAEAGRMALEGGLGGAFETRLKFHMTVRGGVCAFRACVRVRVGGHVRWICAQCASCGLSPLG